MKNKQQSVESVTVWPGRALLIDTQNPCDFAVMSRREISGDIGENWRHAVKTRDYNFSSHKKWQHMGVLRSVRFSPQWGMFVEGNTVVEARGFEPLTPASRTQCATGLRYASI